VDFVKFLSIISPLIPIIVGYRRRLTLLWVYAITGLTFDLLIPFLKRVLHVNYSWPGNLYVLLEFVMISLYYSQQVVARKMAAYVFIGLLCLFFIGTTLNSGMFVFNAFGASVFCFVFILYGISGLYKMLQEQKVLFLEQSAFFWVNVAFIIYASGNFLLFLFLDYLSQQDDGMLRLLWGVSFLILNIVKNIFLGIALSKKTQPWTSPAL
jgi:hypothetical protein